MNNLKSEKSSYLKSAARQPVNWYPWCTEAFNIAKENDLPVLLDIGAVWCHWCHVMDKESYEDEETANIINENFIAIKVDKDERPDIDSRYQKAVSAFCGNGGWPLTAFLTYEGYFFYGGTYFPKEAKYGMPSYKSVLAEIGKYYRENKEAVFSQSKDFYNRIFKDLNKFSIFNIRRVSEAVKGDKSLSKEYAGRLLNEAAQEFKLHFDNENGGLDESPKFFYFSGLELLLQDYMINRDMDSLSKGTFTLKKMVFGGVFDHVGGGFHRYSTDKKWIVPHFEKLAGDNANALRVYLNYYRVTGDKVMLNAINRTMDFITNDMYDRMNGGFYASMDADAADGDDGSFFTWTLDELKDVFAKNEELKAVINLFNIGKGGRIPGQGDNGSGAAGVKINWVVPNVLYVGSGEQEEDIILSKFYNNAISRLKSFRDKRKQPFIDKIKYSSVNGNVIYSITELSKIFNPCNDNNGNRRKLNEIAEKSIKPFLDAFDKNGDVGRFIGEPGGSLLEDNAYIILALIGLSETTSKPMYLIYAKRIAEHVIKNYYDSKEGGFFDIKHTIKSSKIGFLSHKEKSIIDYGGYSPNSMILLGMAKLYALTNEIQFQNVILKSFEYFINDANNFKHNSSSYIISLADYAQEYC
ncbi:MAG: DUF255 domain-containing protein [Deltaproteobacteria bacterium]|jgi:uncharacterized protein YyaL (SSP411 family)|nr:DUF255 domain-containing protein [Deltaproteobacteria bacterium]MCL5880199.1 DUF255 domain-containing protein [Deltaproteobacteria bacterium]MDA8304751.1 DUF255 domain-containing protein [Deltaproteobacteria bacterium]